MDALPSLPPAEISLVVSNRKAAYGLVRAQSATPPIPTAVHALQTFLKSNPGKTRVDYDLALADLVNSTRPDLVLLAGFMHILSRDFIQRLPKHVPLLNLHPSLPGLFPGAKAIERAHQAFRHGELPDGKTGVMVHEVNHTLWIFSMAQAALIPTTPTMFQVVEEVDAGRALVVIEMVIQPGETLESLEARFHEVEHHAIVQAVDKVLTELHDAR
jgi:phosphoribosylglycinamide formyltransferase